MVLTTSNPHSQKNLADDSNYFWIHRAVGCQRVPGSYRIYINHEAGDQQKSRLSSALWPIYKADAWRLGDMQKEWQLLLKLQQYEFVVRINTQMPIHNNQLQLCGFMMEKLEPLASLTYRQVCEIRTFVQVVLHQTNEVALCGPSHDRFTGRFEGRAVLTRNNIMSNSKTQAVLVGCFGVAVFKRDDAVAFRLAKHMDESCLAKIIAQVMQAEEQQALRDCT